MKRNFSAVVTVLALLASTGFAQTRPKESLRGISGVYLYVHPVGKEVEAGGLSTGQIDKAVRAQLREAGVPLDDQPQPADGSANFVVIIDTVKQPQGVYIFEVQVSLLQEVHLARRQQPDPFPAETWSAKAIGLTTPNRMDILLAPLKEKAAEFIEDYRSVNPRLSLPK